jgi:hypothetical protein
VNLATYKTDQNFNVNYAFSLNFTSPSNAFDAQVFNLNIQQTTNPSPDNVFNISQALLKNLGPCGFCVYRQVCSTPTSPQSPQ